MELAMDAKQLEALYGPGAQFSDNKPGDTITYRSGGREITDVILYVIAPAQHRGIIYVMTQPDPATSLPALCFPNERIEDPEPALYTCLKCGGMHTVGQGCPLA